MRDARVLKRAWLVVLAFATVGPSLAMAQTVDEDVAAIRQVTEKYRDVQAALADGYLRDPGNLCVTAGMMGLPPETGGMGIHYFRPDLLGITAVEPRVTGADAALEWTQPEVLVYEPQADGALVLVAAEYLVFKAPWDAVAGPDTPPVFHDAAFTLMADDPATEPDEAHAFEPHYELHVWTERENPAGMFAEFNPAVSCAAAPPQAAPHAGHGE